MTVASGAMTGAERMLATCRRQPTDATPVWFMRQAGRSLARYRALREQYPILTLAKTPDLCAQVTLMPVDELGVDGAVLFADIMLPIEAMGVSLEIQPDIGPIIHEPIRDMAAVERLRPMEPEEGVPFVLETIRLLRSELSDGRAAVIGFSAGPGGLPFGISSLANGPSAGGDQARGPVQPAVGRDPVDRHRPRRQPRRRRRPPGRLARHVPVPWRSWPTSRSTRALCKPPKPLPTVSTVATGTSRAVTGT